MSSKVSISLKRAKRSEKIRVSTSLKSWYIVVLILMWRLLLFLFLTSSSKVQFITRNHFLCAYSSTSWVDLFYFDFIGWSCFCCISYKKGVWLYLLLSSRELHLSKQSFHLISISPSSCNKFFLSILILFIISIVLVKRRCYLRLFLGLLNVERNFTFRLLVVHRI